MTILQQPTIALGWNRAKPLAYDREALGAPWQMAVLSEATGEKVRELFPPEQHDTVARVLETECGNNLPFLEKEDSYGLERFRFAALKLSEGNIEKLHGAVKLAKSDWRDLLVAAGFADSVDAHKHWVIG
jgi:hypothetical protein